MAYLFGLIKSVAIRNKTGLCGAGNGSGSIHRSGNRRRPWWIPLRGSSGHSQGASLPWDVDTDRVVDQEIRAVADSRVPFVAGKKSN